MMQVLIVDDHPIVLQGCRRVLQGIGIDSITEAIGLTSGYRAFLRRRPACVVTDLTFEGDDLAGLALIRRIAEKDQATRIVVFSMHDDPAIVSRALSSGAQGYVLKDGPSSELTTAFTRMLAGEPHLSHELAIKVAMLRAKGDQSHGQSLTSREQQILSLLGLGNSYDKIATKLGISHKTVTNATSLIRAKLKLASLAELIRFAMNNNTDRAS